MNEVLSITAITISLVTTLLLFRVYRRLTAAHNSLVEWADEAEAQLDRLECAEMEP
jgi:hypothetical protein